MADQGKRRVSDRVVERLSLYRRILHQMELAGTVQVFSHELAARSGVTAGLLRRDLMAIGHTGSPNRGYEVAGLGAAIGAFLDGGQRQAVALVGVGHLGRALLDYFRGRRPTLEITAAFDVDPDKVGRVIAGTRVHALDELEARVAAEGIRAAILALPPDQAQRVTDRLAAAGVRSLLNFADVRLSVPDGLYVETLDFSVSLEKVAYYSRTGEPTNEPT